MTTSQAPNAEQWDLIQSAVARLRASVMAVVFGLTGGIGLWFATIWLVLRGGQNVGYHLGLLSNYFPGYTVSWGGAFLGLCYGAIVGGLVGWSLAWIYNRVADMRNGRGS